MADFFFTHFQIKRKKNTDWSRGRKQSAMRCFKPRNLRILAWFCGSVSLALIFIVSALLSMTSPDRKNSYLHNMEASRGKPLNSSAVVDGFFDPSQHDGFANRIRKASHKRRLSNQLSFGWKSCYVCLRDWQNSRAARLHFVEFLFNRFFFLCVGIFHTEINVSWSLKGLHLVTETKEPTSKLLLFELV